MLKLVVIGYLGKDAVIKDFQGKKVVNFSVAYTEKWKDNEGVEHSKTIWVECSWWKKENMAQYLKKGQQVYLEGDVTPHSYVKNDGSGELVNLLRLDVRGCSLLGKKPQDAASQ